MEDKFNLPVIRKSIIDIVGKKYKSLMGINDLVILEDVGVKYILGTCSSKYVLIENKILYSCLENILKELGYTNIIKRLNTDFICHTGEYIIQEEIERNIYPVFKLVHSYVGRIKTSLYFGIYVKDIYGKDFCIYSANEAASLNFSDDGKLKKIKDEEEVIEYIKERTMLAVMNLTSQQQALDNYNSYMQETYNSPEADYLLKKACEECGLPKKAVNLINIQSYFLRAPYHITKKDLYFEINRYLYNSQFSAGEKIKIDKLLYKYLINQ